MIALFHLIVQRAIVNQTQYPLEIWSQKLLVHQMPRISKSQRVSKLVHSIKIQRLQLLLTITKSLHSYSDWDPSHNLIITALTQVQNQTLTRVRNPHNHRTETVLINLTLR